jgi:hypothetical protein
MIRIFLEGNYSVARTALLLQPLFIKFPLIANKALKTPPLCPYFSMGACVENEVFGSPLLC